MRLSGKIGVLCATVLCFATQPSLANSSYIKTKDRFGQTILVPSPAGLNVTNKAPKNRLEVLNPYGLHPVFLRQIVSYDSKYDPGTIVVDTKTHFLYLVINGGQAMRYGIGVARSGFEWSGTHKVTAKREWPGWTPPEEMRAREPHLPQFMPGGPDNPLGARALYLGNTLYRLHGTSQPWSIGQNVSSGCIRLTNEDIIDLYNRVPVGSEVVVI